MSVRTEVYRVCLVEVRVHHLDEHEPTAARESFVAG